MKFKREVPSRGWFHIQKETRLKILGESLDDLSKKVSQHRTYKGLSRATLEECSIDIQRQICSRLSARECVSEGIEDEWVPVKDVVLPGMEEIISFSKAAFEWIASGRQLVPEEESKRRAEICKGCQMNSPLHGCSCGLIYKMIASAVPLERRDAELGICGCCSCELKSKVNLPESVIRASNKGRDLRWPSHCWQGFIMENDIASKSTGA